MIKQIARFFLVLGVSAVVCGAMYLIFSNSSVGSTGEDNRPVLQAGTREQGLGFEGHREGGGEGGQVNFAGVLLNVGKVSLISLVIVLANLGYERVIGKRKQRLFPRG
jgi:hypothetical protein